MDCKGFRQTLDLYVDGELAPEATTAAQLHEQECVACRRVVATLLGIRRQMKSTVAQHQPPPELISAVRRISQPRWKRLFGISEVQGSQASGPRKFLSVWRKNIAVPLPVFTLLLIAVAFGASLVSLRIEKAPSSIPDAHVLPPTQYARQVTN